MNIDHAFDEALGRYTGDNFESLCERDRVLVAIWAIEAEVNNGGFSQFYFNEAGDVAYYAPDALRLIGAEAMATIATEANTKFGASGPARLWDERQKQLANLEEGIEDLWESEDQAFYAYPDDISELLAAYLNKKKEGEQGGDGDAEEAV